MLSHRDNLCIVILLLLIVKLNSKLFLLRFLLLKRHREFYLTHRTENPTLLPSQKPIISIISVITDPTHPGTFNQGPPEEVAIIIDELDELSSIAPIVSDFFIFSSNFLLYRN